VDARIEPEVGAYPGGALLSQTPRNFAIGVVQVAEQDCLAAVAIDRLGAGRHRVRAVAVDAMDAKRAGFDRTLAARRHRQLVAQRFVDERARLVGAGHHAIAATDAGMLVDQHDAVGALERRARGADIDTGRSGAMLAHHRQHLLFAGAQIAEMHLADPLRVRRRAGLAVPAVFALAGLDAGVDVGLAERVGIDQQPPARRAGGGGARLADAVQHYAGRDQGRCASRACDERGNCY